MMRSVCLALLLLTQIGCAQYMAITQAGPLNRSQIVPGAERMQIIRELGAPKMTDEEASDRIVDTYNYTDGGQRNHKGWRIGRAVLYTAGDFVMLFLTQLIWMPAELLLKGTDYMAVVEYEPGAGATWIAARITETRLSGSSEVTVTERPGFAEERAATLAAQWEEKKAAAAAAAASEAAAATATRVGGTCFAVAPDGLLITANHLLGSADRIGVDLADGRAFDAAVERRNAASDTALLRVQGATPQYIPPSARAGVAVGEFVFTLGHGAMPSAPAQLADGTLVALASAEGDASTLRAAIPAAEGDAGAPLVDERGEVIGMVTKPSFPAVAPAATATALPDGLWATRSDRLRSLLTDDVSPRLPATSRADAIARARAAVCRVRPAITQEASTEAVPAAEPAVEATAAPPAPVTTPAPVESATP